MLVMFKFYSPSELLQIIDKMKKELRTNETVVKTFEEYDLNIKELDLVPMYFKDLNVSAKTDHGIIFFNYKLLDEGFESNYSYAVHELVHYCQQTSGEHPTQSADDGDYLLNKYEQEGFQNQVEYIANDQGEGKAEKYVDDLLDYHDKEGKEKKKLEKVLLKNIS